MLIPSQEVVDTNRIINYKSRNYDQITNTYTNNERLMCANDVIYCVSMYISREALVGRTRWISLEMTVKRHMYFLRLIMILVFARSSQVSGKTKYLLVEISENRGTDTTKGKWDNNKPILLKSLIFAANTKKSLTYFAVIILFINFRDRGSKLWWRKGS